MDKALALPYWSIRQRDGVWKIFHFRRGGFTVRLVMVYGWPRTMHFSDN